MTRVLQVLGRSAGGIARHVAQVVEALDRTEGLEIDIAGPPDLPVEMPKQMHEVVIPDGPVKGHPAAISKLRRLVAENEYDVVHAHGLRAGIDSSLATRRGGPPTYVTIHNLVRPEIAGRKATIYRFAETLVVRLSDRTFAVSQDIANEIRGRVGSAGNRIEVMHLAAGPRPEVTVDRDEVRKALDVPADHALIVTASRLSPQKAMDIMLHALSLLRRPATLAVFGVGPLEQQLRSLAVHLGVSERVRWLGFRRGLADHLAAADAFCLSSIWEGVPLAAMEAIQLRTPVVATAVGGLPELIVDGRSGRLVEPRQPRLLAAALLEVLTDPRVRQTYVENAAIDLERNFSSERMLRRLVNVYGGATDA